MKTRWHKRHTCAALVAAGFTVACVALVGQAAQGDESDYRPLIASDFKQAAPRGFGDRNNGWAESMVWWHNHLYVGTSRAPTCFADFAVCLLLPVCSE